MTQILVLNGSSYATAVQGLGTIVTNTKVFISQPRKFDLILFTGGEDVSPELYGETSPRGYCGNSPFRDREEREVFKIATALNIPCAGICRGIQFLNVMCGGKMMHHINNHGGVLHKVVTNQGKTLEVNSYHHQMVLPPKEAVVIAWAKRNLSNEYIGDRDLQVRYRGIEVESAVYPEQKCFGVQWHPEWMDKNSDGYLFFHEMVRNALSLPWKEFISLYVGEQQNELHGGNTMCASG